MWFSKPIPYQNAKIVIGLVTSRQSAGLKEVAKRDNPPGRIMDEPLTLSTLSWTHRSCGHTDPQIDSIAGLPIQPQQYMSVPTKKIFLLTENMTKNATSKH